MATDRSDVAVEPTVEQVAVEPKKTKEPKAKKPKAAAKKPKTAASHPTYADMIMDAIVNLKERNGSSQYAIAKFVEQKEKNLPANFRKLLLGNLRKLVTTGKITKVKGSFKIPTTPKLATGNKPKAIKPKAVVKAAKPKKSPAKAKATKPKAVAAAKPKPAAKAKTAAKPKPAVKAKPKVSEKPTKAVRTSTRTTPGKKAAAPKVAVKKAAGPKKAKVVKTPVKKDAKK